MKKKYGILCVFVILFGTNILEGGPMNQATVDEAMKTRILEDWFEGYNKRDWQSIESLYSDEALVHGKVNKMYGGQSVSGLMKQWTKAFPDAIVTPVYSCIEEDVVIVHWKISGTFKGSIRDFKSSGDSVSFHGLTCFRCKEGKVIEHWASIDYRPLSSGNTNPHTVICFLEAKPGKEAELKTGLVKIAELSRQEDSCIQYSMYQDPANTTQFALFEKWKSKELHALQFSKPYILEFMSVAEPLLAKPYAGFFGNEVVQ